jgi:hypothetical protein
MVADLCLAVMLKAKLISNEPKHLAEIFKQSVEGDV